MGEFYRATTITPVPRRYGVRGGNAIARSPEKAIQLCALHALDVLCALDIPLFLEEAKQRQFLRRRRLLGMITPDGMKRRMVRPKSAMYMLKTTNGPAETDELGGDPSARAGETPANSDPQAKFYTSPMPGYMIEGNVVRFPPRSDDTLSILQLRLPEDCVIFGEGFPEDEIQALGNDAKVCVQNYMRQQHSVNSKEPQPVRKAAAGANLPEGDLPHDPTRPPADDPAEDLSPTEHEELEKLSEWIRGFPLNVNPSLYVTGYGKQVSVYNIAYIRLPVPSARGGEHTPPAVKPLNSKKNKADLKTTETNPTAAISAVLSEVTMMADAFYTPSLQGRSAPATSPILRPGDRPKVEVQPTPDPDGEATRDHLLAVGMSLKKKDAERMCFLHAATLLKYHYNEDVLQNYRLGLPRKGGATSCEDIQKMYKPSSGANAEVEDAKEKPEGDQDGKGGLNAPQSKEAEIQPHPAPPGPFLHNAMKTFMGSGRSITQPRRRPLCPSFNPFYKGEREAS
ncbi:unnamed protein product [Phytomonas sp. Hart1]|nr:unnamed protein product [Phytomonas sp. Hart1]|eukprot:CCW71770.1 unnamed protein product [Phytomonas sp. isolate Hart1]